MSDINSAILERLEKVVDSLQENSVKMGQLLAVHNEKLDKQDRIDAVLFEKIESVHREVNRRSDEIKKGCERDIRKVDDRLRVMEKKMWTNTGKHRQLGHGTGRVSNTKKTSRGCKTRIKIYAN